MATAEEVERNRARQAELYGEPLGDLLGDVAARLGLTQAALARTLGLSAPMLSQLMSAQRVKIGNPAVVQRVQALVELADDLDGGRVTPEEVAGRLAAVRDVRGVVTGSSSSGRQARPVHELQALLRAAASADELIRAAQVLEADFPRVAEILRVYGAGRTDEAIAHYESLGHLL